MSRQPLRRELRMMDVSGLTYRIYQGGTWKTSTSYIIPRRGEIRFSTVIILIAFNTSDESGNLQACSCYYRQFVVTETESMRQQVFKPVEIPITRLDGYTEVPMFFTANLTPAQTQPSQL
jgi:hypothetical protein